MQEFVTLFTNPKSGGKLPFAWTGTLNLARLNPIPHRYRPGRRRSRSNKEWARPRDDLTGLKTSANPLDTIRAIRRHRWSLWDLQHLFIFSLIVFSLAVAEAPVWFKLGFPILMSTLLLLPVTRQFFWPAMPIITWLVYFFSSR